MVIKRNIQSRKSLLENRARRRYLTESPFYDLHPRYDSRQSFYNKAMVDTGDRGDENVLYSYNTKVAEMIKGRPVVYVSYTTGLPFIISATFVL